MYLSGTTPFIIFSLLSLIGCLALFWIPYDTQGKELDGLIIQYDKDKVQIV